MSSTAQATPTSINTSLDLAKIPPKIQLDETNCISNKTVKISMNGARLLKSPSKLNTSHEINDEQATQLITMPVNQLKDLIKDSVKEAVKEIREEVDDFRYELMSENLKFKMEIFKEFTNLEVI